MTENTEISEPSQPALTAIPSISSDLSAMKQISDILTPLAPEARERIMTYILTVFQIDGPKKMGTMYDDTIQDGEEPPARGEAITLKFDSFAELYDAARQPTGNPEKALVAGYWLQVCQSAESFDAQSANNELKNLGHALPNVTNSFESLKKKKPALVLQLKKSGTTQQARKTYKLTIAGKKAVEEMIVNG